MKAGGIRHHAPDRGDGYEKCDAIGGRDVDKRKQAPAFAAATKEACDPVFVSYGWAWLVFCCNAVRRDGNGVNGTACYFVRIIYKGALRCGATSTCTNVRLGRCGRRLQIRQ